MLDTLIDLIKGNIPLILTLVLSIGVVGVFVNKITKFVKELNDLLAKTLEVVADKKITSNELEQLKKEAGDVVKLFKKAKKG